MNNIMSETTVSTWTAARVLDFLSDHADTLRAMGVIRLGIFRSYVRDEQTA